MDLSGNNLSRHSPLILIFSRMYENYLPKCKTQHLDEACKTKRSTMRSVLHTTTQIVTLSNPTHLNPQDRISTGREPRPTQLQIAKSTQEIGEPLRVYKRAKVISIPSNDTYTANYTLQLLDNSNSTTLSSTTCTTRLAKHLGIYAFIDLFRNCRCRFPSLLRRYGPAGLEQAHFLAT